MVLAEAPRIYPVFTHHAKELQAASRYLVRRMEQYAGEHEPDEKFNAMLNRYRQVVLTLLRMHQANTPYIYLDREERDLVSRVNAWLKGNPEHKTG